MCVSKVFESHGSTSDEIIEEVAVVVDAAVVVDVDLVVFVVVDAEAAPSGAEELAGG